MRTLKIIQHISLDGVIQAPGSLDEDRDGGFCLGGWIAPFSDPLVKETIHEAHGTTFDLLLGRRTYDIWSGYWPKAERGEIADSLNAARKHVATHRPESLEWGPAEDLGADIVDGIRRAKAMQGPNLVLWGSSSLTPLLIGQGLADEILLFVYPVFLGSGKRLYADGSGPRELSLLTTETASSGVIICTYRPRATP